MGAILQYCYNRLVVCNPVNFSFLVDIFQMVCIGSTVLKHIRFGTYSTQVIERNKLVSVKFQHIWNYLPTQIAL